MEGIEAVYFVDRDKIEKTLLFFEKQLKLFHSNKSWTTDIEKAALERIVHTVIESILDTGNAMIDGFIMRDPGSYDDIVEILTDEKVITPELSETLKTVISFRVMLVQQYLEVDHDAIDAAFREQLHILERFSPSVRTYLLDELGPVSAFRK